MEVRQTFVVQRFQREIVPGVFQDERELRRLIFEVILLKLDEKLLICQRHC